MSVSEVQLLENGAELAAAKRRVKELECNPRCYTNDALRAELTVASRDVRRLSRAQKQLVRASQLMFGGAE